MHKNMLEGHAFTTGHPSSTLKCDSEPIIYHMIDPCVPVLFIKLLVIPQPTSCSKIAVCRGWGM